MFRNIVVPIDLSHPEWAQGALAHVEGFGDDKVTITILHVMEPVPSYVASQLPEDLLTANRARALKQVEQFASDAGSNVQAKVLIGHPASSILEFAEKQNTDLIIIGSHRPGLKDYFLGSTASRVVRHAKCSVLVSR
ncbi:universal stress protein [Pseudahrensia aquimaris]|uniref:Universal stress protein n=1 Tax=Pseudahrensia aquimaris TaxID=744461 RepID=A0ABW3FDD1_9HYPH